MTENRFPLPPSAPDRVVERLPQIFRLQSITRLPGQEGQVFNRAVLFHERASLTVEWLSHRVETQLAAGSLVAIRWLGRPVSLGGAVRIARLVALRRAEPALDLFQTVPHQWVRERALIQRASALWRQLRAHFRHLFNAIFWDGRRLHRYLVGVSSLSGHDSDLKGNFRHTLEVAEQALRLADGQALACPDVLLIAALLHDAGNADEYRLGGRGLELTTRGRLIGHRHTIIEWVAEAAASIRMPQAHYVGLLHVLTSARDASEWLGIREPCTLEAALLAIADRLSGQVELMVRHAPAHTGFGPIHPHLRTRPFVIEWAA